ncbi:DUF5134 domain-containing protein [Nocardia rhamnosiphila]|uniref:DUF5134 domain-containing protein n=1 Tax=Nocardia rhamnosiphila TaxID=426716 RepID=UPI0033ECD993
MEDAVIVDLPVRWLVTILFAAAVVGSLHRMWTDRSVAVTVGHVFHIVASLTMLMMAWPGTPVFSTTLQVALFAVASVWFAARAVRSWRTEEADGRSDTPGQSLVGIYHSFTMLAMIWMALVMTDRATTGAGAHHSHPGQASDLSSATETGMTTNAHHHDVSTLPSPPSPSGEGTGSVISLVVAVIFAVAALVWYFRLSATKRAETLRPAALSNRPTLSIPKGISKLTSEPASESAMAVGMAIMMVLMA